MLGNIAIEPCAYKLFIYIADADRTPFRDYLAQGFEGSSNHSQQHRTRSKLGEVVGAVDEVDGFCSGISENLLERTLDPDVIKGEQVHGGRVRVDLQSFLGGRKKVSS